MHHGTSLSYALAACDYGTGLSDFSALTINGMAVLVDHSAVPKISHYILRYFNA